MRSAAECLRLLVGCEKPETRETRGPTADAENEGADNEPVAAQDVKQQFSQAQSSSVKLSQASETTQQFA